MDFARPQWLWLLAALPVVAVAVALAERRRRRGWRAIALPGRPPADGGGAWVLAMALLVVALAQPRWGRGGGETLPPGRDVVLVVDVSWSMAAEDVVPNRIGRAVAAAETLTRAVGRDPGDRAAVVAFAGRGVVRCPLTTNLGAVVEALRSLRPGGVEPGGSDLGAGVDAALDALDDEPRAGGRVVVVFSDGEDHAPSWPSRVDRLRALGVVVHTVALGDAGRGHPIPIGPTGRDGRGVLADGGEAVETRRVDLELRGLALATGGAFVPLGVAEGDLAELYTKQIAPAERRTRAAPRPSGRVERFGVFVLAALAVGLVGSWPRRRRPTRPRPWWRSWALLGVASAAIASGADRVESAADAVAEGVRAFGRRDLDAALDAFDRAALLAPTDPIPDYNAAATLYQLGRFGEARDRYLGARERSGAALLTKIDYALGNTAVALGDVPTALRHYDDCLGSTVPGAPYDRIRAFARDNRAFAERLTAPGASTAEGDEPGTPGESGPDGGRGPGEGEPGDPPSDGPPGDRPGPSAPGDPAGSGGGPGAAEPTGSAAVSGSGTASGRLPRGDSPADRLADALESIQAARDRRLPDLPRAPTGSPGRPHW